MLRVGSDFGVLVGIVVVLSCKVRATDTVVFCGLVDDVAQQRLKEGLFGPTKLGITMIFCGILCDLLGTVGSIQDIR